MDAQRQRAVGWSDWLDGLCAKSILDGSVVDDLPSVIVFSYNVNRAFVCPDIDCAVGIALEIRDRLGGVICPLVNDWRDFLNLLLCNSQLTEAVVRGNSTRASEDGEHKQRDRGDAR